MINNRQEEEYKERLFQTMEDIGLVDNVRTQVRQKLLDKLKHPPRTKQIKPDQILVKKICASLIIDYLSLNQHNYTLSVFQPQCGFSKNFLPSSQLSQMLKLSSFDNYKSVLESVVENLLPKRSRMSAISTAMQTDDSNSVQSIERRLNSIQLSYKNNADSLQLMKVMEGRQERQIKFKNELAKRYRQDLERETRRVRQFEVMNVKLEQREKYNILMKDYRDDIDKQYKQRLDKLRDRQEEVMRRVTDKIKQMQSHGFDQRQKVLKDMEYIKLKERQLQIFKQSLQERQKIVQKISRK